MAKRKINPNLLSLRHALKNDFSGCVLEGGSRSGKTWASVDFLIYLCSRIEEGSTINILKETYNSFKTTLFEDFNRRFPMFGLESPSANVQELKSFKLFGNKINLIGADKASKAHGVSCDYLWCNEAVHIPEKVFNQYKQRCRKFWFMDYNPEFTEHYIYDKIIPRDDVYYLKTTMLDNPYISAAEKREILAYDPSNPENIRQGTADQWHWDVYGEGKRSAPKGVVFPNWRIVKELPEELKNTHPLAHWLDFGYSNDPAACGCIWKYRGELYIDEHFYELGLTNVINEDNPQQPSIEEKFIELNFCNEDLIVADSAEKKSIQELRLCDYQVVPIAKEKIYQGINRVKKHKINIVSSAKNIITERDQYKWKENNLTGALTNDAIDKHNHHMDGIRYVVKYLEETEVI